MIYRKPHLVVALITWGLPLQVLAVPARVDVGNDVYHVVVNDVVGGAGRDSWAGFEGAYAGTSHPVSQHVGRPAELLELLRDCISCPGAVDLSHASLRSYESRIEYTLGRAPWFLHEASPGFECFNANALRMPSLTTIVVDGVEQGVRATWVIDNASDHFRVELEEIVHGDDFLGGSVELTHRIVNTGSETARVGLREMLDPTISQDVIAGNDYGRYFLGLRPPDPPVEPFVTTETEWEEPTFRMWEAVPLTPRPADVREPYAVAGVIAPILGLDPEPVSPDFLQVAALGVREFPPIPASSGVTDRCFDWRVGASPRPLRSVPDRVVVASYWGHDETHALVVPPGGEVRVTQYLVAYREYPLTALMEPSPATDCQGSVTRVPISGSAVPIEPTIAPAFYRWSSDDPAVTFADPALASTEALVTSPGTHAVRLTVAIGVYEASVDGEVTVIDDDPPRFTALSATPSALWPPNHRMVPVEVTVALEDCDPLATYRLVSVTSDEPDDEHGDGHTSGDIEDVDLGTADTHVLLRAERSGGRDGREYVLTYSAEDTSGNLTEESVSVRVPHDRRSGSRRPVAPRPPPRRP
jgi:hypothetical protein